MRYFMYNAEQDPPLTYYTIDRHFKPKKEPGGRGSFYVLSVTAKNAYPGKEHGFQMEVLETRGMECMPGAGVTLHMAATSHVEKRKWVSAIESGISRIMKRAVGVIEPLDYRGGGGSPRGHSSHGGSEPRSESSGHGGGTPHERKKLSMQDFNVLRLLGRGNFGTVVLVELKCHALPMQHTRHHAVKILNKQRMNSYTRHGTKREREIMAGVTHPFIATLAFAFQTHDKLFLGMEYLQGGDLFHHLRRCRRRQSAAKQQVGVTHIQRDEHTHTHPLLYTPTHTHPLIHTHSYTHPLIHTAAAERRQKSCVQNRLRWIGVGEGKVLRGRAGQRPVPLAPVRYLLP
jgi:hypothetical protein